jgi:RNA polymerase sigma-70 factor (ECF subfamily)
MSGARPVAPEVEGHVEGIRNRSSMSRSTIMVEGDFAGLLARAKSGDAAAIGGLLSTFEDEVRMMVRVRLPRSLRAQFDSMDFVQAVWQSVFAGWAEGSVDFEDARHFRGFLAGVARNKVLAEYRKRTQSKKYALSREERLYVRRGDREEPREVVAPDPSPSQEIQARDCWDRMVEGRPTREAEVIELRRQGLTFEEIAERTGQSERSVRRVIEAVRLRMEARRWI